MNLLKKLTMGIAISATGLSLVACNQEQKPPQKSAPALVSAVTIEKQEVPITYEYAGRVAAYRETQVRARVGGIILHRNFIEGNEVKEGDVLFEIDPATYDAEVARQKAAVAQAQVTYDQSLRDAGRASELLKQRVYSTAQRDQAFATRDANAANLQQAQALLKTAELNLQYTKVTAPISGATSREEVSEGSLIAANGLLTSITQSDPIYVNFSYTDTEAKAIQKIMADMAARGEKLDSLKVRITFGNGVEYAELGTIDFTSPTLDATTGTLGVRAVFDNAKKQLVAGQFVRVTVLGLKLDNSIVIPEESLMQDSNSQFVFIIGNDNMIEKRLVKTIRQVGGRQWLLQPATKVEVDAPVAPASEGQANVEAPKKTEETIGLNGGERVINNGLFTLQQAFGQMPPGAKMPGQLNSLDGKQLAKPAAPQGAAQGGAPAVDQSASDKPANDKPASDASAKDASESKATDSKANDSKAPQTGEK